MVHHAHFFAFSDADGAPDKPIHFGREFALLELFMQNVGRILTRELICEKCWSSDHSNEANLLDVYMSRLRAKFDTGSDGSLFRTVRGVGYQLL